MSTKRNTSKSRGATKSAGKSSAKASSKKAAKKTANKRGASSAKAGSGRGTAATATTSTATVSDSFNELIGRALTDKDFRTQLFDDRKGATRGVKLTKVDKAALERLTPDVLESQAARLGGRAALTIKVVISKSF